MYDSDSKDTACAASKSAFFQQVFACEKTTCDHPQKCLFVSPCTKKHASCGLYYLQKILNKVLMIVVFRKQDTELLALLKHSNLNTANGVHRVRQSSKAATQSEYQHASSSSPFPPFLTRGQSFFSFEKKNLNGRPRLPRDRPAASEGAVRPRAATPPAESSWPGQHDLIKFT